MDIEISEKLKSNKDKLDKILKRRFIVNQSYEIYNGIAGLYDLGPVGCNIKHEIEKIWRNSFLLDDCIYEIHCPNITPYAVLKTSGHVDRFLDHMVEDVVTKDCYRADKYYAEELIKIKPMTDDIQKDLILLEGMNAKELDCIRDKYEIKSVLKNNLSNAFSFNLMFSTFIGPKNTDSLNSKIYLRPETAQGIFVNFKRLLEQNQGKLPFGGTIVGTGFRNEISPKNGLLRVREFPLAEIEFFFDPLNLKNFKKNEQFKDLIIPLWSREDQKANLKPIDIRIDDALNKQILKNNILAYFVGKTYLFLQQIGLKKQLIRFRQHLTSEMAHYSNDCWDAEVLTSYGWIECVGIADRGAYDLTKHSEATKIYLEASRVLDEPLIEEKLVCKLDKKRLGPKLKSNVADVIKFIEEKNQKELIEFENKIKTNGFFEFEFKDLKYKIDVTEVQFEKVKFKKFEETFIPNVIEPAFGIGRLISAVLEQNFKLRDDMRTYFSFPIQVAPYKCSILPLSNNNELKEYVQEIQKNLIKLKLTYKIDDSSVSIGKRYSRNDELGIPFSITIDFETPKTRTITLREIQSCEQTRLGIDVVAHRISDIIINNLSWNDFIKKNNLSLLKQSTS